MTFSRSDTVGQVRFPQRVHLHLPLSIRFFPSTRRLQIYAPSLHNRCVLEERKVWGPMDFRYEKHAAVKLAPAGTTVLLRDLAKDPELWHETFRSGMAMFDRRALETDHREFVAALRQDYAQFVALYASVTRDYRRTSAKVAEDDWVKWDGQPKPWQFFLDIPWYGETFAQRLGRLENEAGVPVSR